jgi:dihydroxy-acid dehydratase
MPRVGVLTPESSGLPELVRQAGGEPIPLFLPRTRLAGIALCREWIADWAQISTRAEELDALLVDAAEPAELAGLLMAALRLDLPAVVAAPLIEPFSVALTGLGFAPLGENPAEVAVVVARSRGPRSRELVESFSLANALRAGLSSGAGPQLIVHLAAIAREAGVAGFPQMTRVLTPESPKIAGSDSLWFRTHGALGLFAHLRATLHDTPTVAGRLKEALPSAPLPPEEKGNSRLVFVRGRASGTEALCRRDGVAEEISGLCRVCVSEEAAIRVVKDGRAGASDLLVVGGCGPRGGSGLLRLDHLRSALDEVGLVVPVLTDGLSPDDVTGTWASLATPEAAAGGVIGRLRDGDPLRLDLMEGLIRTGVRAEEFGRREPLAAPAPSGFDYAARYARSALPALEGAGFG